MIRAATDITGTVVIFGGAAAVGLSHKNITWPAPPPKKNTINGTRGGSSRALILFEYKGYEPEIPNPRYAYTSMSVDRRVQGQSLT